jgi:AI-2 transport protein TqsA
MTMPRPSDRRVQTVCLLILTLIAIGVAMALLQPVLVPFVLALFFAQCLTPAIDFQVHRRVPRVFAITITVILGLSLLTGIGFLIAIPMTKMSQPENLVPFQNSLHEFTERIVTSRPVHWLAPNASNAGRVFNVPEELMVTFVSAVVGETTNILSHGATVLLLLAFILFGRHKPLPGRTGIMAEIEARVQRYITLTVFISALTGVLVGCILGILGVQFAALFGFLAFLLNFIPNLGAIIATILPLPIIWLSPDLSIAAKLLAIILPAAIQIGIGTLQPRFIGSSLQLHPVVLLLALLFFTMIWGVAGAFLATPLTAVIKIIFEKIPATRPLAAALAGDLEPLIRPIDSAEETMETQNAWESNRRG